MTNKISSRLHYDEQTELTLTVVEKLSRPVELFMRVWKINIGDNVLRPITPSKYSLGTQIVLNKATWSLPHPKPIYLNGTEFYIICVNRGLLLFILVELLSKNLFVIIW